jgi:hypothetical protein
LEHRAASGLLGPMVKDTLWITDEARPPGDWMPTAWAEAVEGRSSLRSKW